MHRPLRIVDERRGECAVEVSGEIASSEPAVEAVMPQAGAE